MSIRHFRGGELPDLSASWLEPLKGAFSRDGSGVAGKVEFQYNRLRKIKDFVLPTQYYSYWDIGKVWSEEPRYVGSENLSSAGVGAHFQVLKHLLISPEVAFPLTDSVSA